MRLNANLFSSLSRAMVILGLLFLSACTSTTVSHHESKKTTSNVHAAGINTELGMRYLKQGDVVRAKEKLLLALKQAPNWPPALDAMAYYQEHTGNAQLANEYYKKAIDIEPNDGRVHNNYGTYLCRQKKYAQAQAEFLLAVKDPEYLNVGDAYQNAGVCALKAGDKKSARRYFEQAAAADPEKANLLNKSI